MDDNTTDDSSGVLGFLDTLTNAGASILNQKTASQTAAQIQNNATAVNAVSQAQVAASKSNTMLYLVGAAVVLGVVLLIVRK